MKFIENLDGLLSAKLNLVKDLFSLVRLEANLAGLSLYPLLINLVLCLVFTLSTWLTLSLLIGYLIVFWGGNLLIAILAVLFLNGCVVAFTLRGIAKAIYQMSFAKTRACLTNHDLRNNHELAQKTSEINTTA